MAKVKLTITDSQCRGGYHKTGDSFIVEDLCPPICHELWDQLYPMLYAVLNGAELDYGEHKATMFDVECPDHGRVKVHGERIE